MSKNQVKLSAQVLLDILDRRIQPCLDLSVLVVSQILDNSWVVSIWTREIAHVKNTHM